MNAIEVSGLTKSYGDVHAVRGVDLTIATGEIFALLGPNGAGKTTIVEILEGFRMRDAGQVRVLGFDPHDEGNAARQWRNRIGIVLQSTSDSGDLTVIETIEHFSGYYSNPRNIEEVINSVGLDEKAGSLIRNLSGGQRRRLDVALGIIGNPELLFLDEPTTGFDPEARRSFWALIEKLRGNGTTILLTTHLFLTRNMNQAMETLRMNTLSTHSPDLAIPVRLPGGGGAVPPPVKAYLEGGIKHGSTSLATSFEGPGLGGPARF